MPNDDDRPGQQKNLLKFHKPRLRINEAPTPPLKQESKQCLRHLAAYRAPKSRMQFPRTRCAAVLVALFVGRMGDLYVLLSRRSATLRSYAGDTSLPGGKVEPDDKSIEDTARREAFEEIGLPMDRKRVPLLCIMEPFLAGNLLIVTPVVVLILDNSLQPILNADEVASLFSHPLSAFLSTTSPFPSEPETFELSYHTYTDMDWWRLGTMRMHRFLTGREAGGTKPVFGLTASILVRVAIIGYGYEPEFDLFSQDEPTTEQRIAHGLLYLEKMKTALADEGIDPRKAVPQVLVEEVHAKLAQTERKRRGEGQANDGGGGSAEIEVYQKSERRRRRRKRQSRL